MWTIFEGCNRLLSSFSANWMGFDTGMISWVFYSPSPKSVSTCLLFPFSLWYFSFFRLLKLWGPLLKIPDSGTSPRSLLKHMIMEWVRFFSHQLLFWHGFQSYQHSRLDFFSTRLSIGICKSNQFLQGRRSRHKFLTWMNILAIYLYSQVFLTNFHSTTAKHFKTYSCK